MVIVLVVDSFKDISNGIFMMVFCFFEVLKKRGYVMRVVVLYVDNLGSEEEGYYNFKECYIFLVIEILYK